jgi:sec-independent protein translocase protein TatC
MRRNKRDPEGRMAVLDHLRELRRRVVWMVIIIALGAVLGWVFYNPILEVLKHPYCSVPYQHRLGGAPGDGDNCKLFFNAPLDGFTSRLKISVIAGAVLTGPIWLYQVWAFITPGLKKNERKYSLSFIAGSTVLFVAGAGLAYLVLAKGLRILIGAGGSGTAAALSINNYISFVVLMLVVFGAAFELPLLVVMANMVGVLPAKLLKKSQRIAIFLIFLFAAVATPSTDPFTMCAMAVPMAVLFEGAVVFAIFHDRRKARRKAERKAERAAAKAAAGEGAAIADDLEAAEDLEDDIPSQIDPMPSRLDSSWSETT